MAADFFGNQLFMGMIGINSDNFIFRLYVEVMSNGAMGWAFVYTGSRIVPSNRKIVAYVLAVAAILIAGGAMLPAIVQQDWWAIIGIIAVAGGAGLIVYQVTEGEIDLDVHRLT